MKTYKIDPLGKNRPLMLVRGTRLPESFPDSVAEHMAKSLKANCRGVFTTINGEISSSTVSPGVVMSREANEDNNTLVVMTEGMHNESVEWEDNTGKQFRLEHEGQFVGSQYGGHDLYYTGAHKDLRTFVTGAVPYTGQPLVADNAKQWYSYTTPEGVALTFRGCIQAPIKEGTDFVGLKIDSINFLSSDTSPSFKLTLDCDSAISLGLRNGMNDNSKPFNMRTGIGWLQIVATDDFTSHINGFSESAGNGDATITHYGDYDGFTYNVDLAALNTQPGGWVSAGNNASFRIYVKSGSALEDSIISSASGYACESLGYDMSGLGDTFPMVEEVSPTLNAEPTVVNLTPDNRKQAVVVRFSSVQDGEQLHLDLSDTVTAPRVIHFRSMNTAILGTKSIDSGKKSFVIDIPSGDDVFAYFGVNYNAAGTLTISRAAANLATVQDKVRNDLKDTYFLSQLADNFEVVTLTGENQEVAGSVRDEEHKINKVFVVPAGEGGFKTNMTCLSRQLNKKADETYSTTIYINLPLNVNRSETGFEFNKVSDKDVYLLPLGWTSKFVLTAITAEQITSDAALVQTARAPHDSADQVLAAVLAACGTDLSTANAMNAFTNKITGFDVSNSGDYIYVNAADVKNMYLNGNAWFEIISKTGEQYKHEFISDAESDGTITVETILRNHIIPVEGTSIFIAKKYGDTCALLAEPKQTPGFYGADGQLIKAMRKNEIENDYEYGNCPSIVNAEIKNATSFVWPEGVRLVGANVFSGCTGLTSVTIPDGVGLVKESSFKGCTGLTSVTIPEGVTSIDMAAFSGCTGLTSVTIPSTVTSIGIEAFGECTSLNPLTVPNTVTTIDLNAFKDVPKVIYGGTASGSPWGATEVSTVGSTPDPEPEPTREAGFYSANGQLIKAMTKAEVETHYTASNCPSKVNAAIKNATEFVWPEGVTRVGNNVFRGTKLTSVTIPEGVTSIGSSSFSGCSSLTSVTIPAGVTTIRDCAFGDCSSLTSVTIPEGVKSLGDGAFSGCSALNQLTVPNTVTTIGVIAFSGVQKVIYNGSAPGSPWGAKEVATS